MSIVAFYMLMLLFFGGLAWLVSGFRGVQRLDERAAATLRRLRSGR